MDPSHQPPAGNAIPPAGHDSFIYAAPRHTSPRNNTALTGYPASPTATTTGTTTTGSDWRRRTEWHPWISLSVPHQTTNPRHSYRRGFGTRETAIETGLYQRLDCQDDPGPLPRSLQIDPFRVSRYYGSITGTDWRLCLCGRSNAGFAPSCRVLSNHRSWAPWAPWEHKTNSVTQINLSALNFVLFLLFIFLYIIFHNITPSFLILRILRDNNTKSSPPRIPRLRRLLPNIRQGPNPTPKTMRITSSPTPSLGLRQHHLRIRRGPGEPLSEYRVAGSL